MTPSRATTAMISNRTRLAAALLIVGVVMALVSPTTATARPDRPAVTATNATTATARTTMVRRVTVLTKAGHLRQRYTVTRHGKGHCWTSSMVNGRLYRCFKGNFVLDPCWKLSGHRAVVCLRAPWTRKVTRLRLTRKLPATDRFGPALWGLRVGDGIGVNCEISQGAAGTVDGKGISYYCQHNWVLLGHPDRSTSPWTIATAKRVNGHYERRGRHHLRVAWKAVVH